MTVADVDEAMSNCRSGKPADASSRRVDPPRAVACQCVAGDAQATGSLSTRDRTRSEPRRRDRQDRDRCEVDDRSPGSGAAPSAGGRAASGVLPVPKAWPNGIESPPVAGGGAHPSGSARKRRPIGIGRSDFCQLSTQRPSATRVTRGRTADETPAAARRDAARRVTVLRARRPENQTTRVERGSSRRSVVDRVSTPRHPSNAKAVTTASSCRRDRDGDPSGPGRLSRCARLPRRRANAEGQEKCP